VPERRPGLLRRIERDPKLEVRVVAVVEQALVDLARETAAL
jgi:hypothetical protein